VLRSCSNCEALMPEALIAFRSCPQMTVKVVLFDVAFEVVITLSNNISFGHRQHARQASSRNVGAVADWPRAFYPGSCHNLYEYVA
jgi:hypothetical protein